MPIGHRMAVKSSSNPITITSPKDILDLLRSLDRSALIEKMDNVLIVDDSELLRSYLRETLQELPGVEVVGEAGDGVEALEAVAADPPDLVLMDVAMPRLSGLEATAELKRKFPQVKVLILTMYDNPEYITEARAAGADGFMLKDAGSAHLQQIVSRMASEGSHWDIDATLPSSDPVR